MENKKVELTTIQALELCQNELGDIPFTVRQQETVGRPIAEVIGILEQIKQALIRNSVPKDAAEAAPKVTKRVAKKVEVTPNAGSAAE